MSDDTNTNENPLERGLDLMSDHWQDLLRVHSFGKTAIAAWHALQRRRMTLFLHSLDAAVGATGARRRELEEALKTPVAQELLGDYVDTVLRTSSAIATSALALLFADVHDVEFDRSFKIIACQALRGITDQQVEIFLQLSDVEQFVTEKISDDPFRLHRVSKVANLKPVVAEIEPTLIGQLTAVNDLINRGMLAPDPAVGGRAAANEPEFGPYGVSDRSKQFRELLIVAKGQIHRTHNLLT